MSMDKIEFYQKIYECNPNHETITHMVIEGDALGEKAVCSNGKLVWTSEENGFMKRCEPYITGIKGSGMSIVEGKQVYSEVIGHEKKLVICGAGHVSMAIIQMGRMIGLSVTVIEDRTSFADTARRQGADTVICDTFENGLAQIPGDEDTYFVIVTRAHRWDRECLRIISGKPNAYVGMMGSKRRVGLVLDSLRKEGVPEEFLSRVCTPIGLRIGAETPEEIAVSVMAQIIEVKNRDKRSFAYSREMMDAILGLRHSETGSLRKGPDIQLDREMTTLEESLSGIRAEGEEQQNESLLSGMQGMVREVHAMVSAVSQLSLQMDGETVGRLVSPAVSRELYREAQIARR